MAAGVLSGGANGMQEVVGSSSVHFAEAAARGFYCPTLFALDTLAEQASAEAAIAIERLDDIEIVADGNTRLYQLKQS